jgi:phosphate starvation-inducible protein PhoH
MGQRLLITEAEKITIQHRYGMNITLLEQSDKFKDKTKSGLYDAKKRLGNVRGIGVFEFGNEDIVRNPIISEILERYE